LSRGEPLPQKLPHFDLILAADCVYFEPAFPLLVQTLDDLAGRDDGEILFCYKKRRKVRRKLILLSNFDCSYRHVLQADKRFFTMLRKKFNWEEVAAALVVLPPYQLIDSPGN
jgi:protein N-lysine methyltransferase METTL21A